jgi:hypothetical protein
VTERKLSFQRPQRKASTDKTQSTKTQSQLSHRRRRRRTSLHGISTEQRSRTSLMTWMSAQDQESRTIQKN